MNTDLCRLIFILVDRILSINNTHKKIIKFPDYHNVSKEFLNIRTENLLKMVESEISLIEAIPCLH